MGLLIFSFYVKLWTIVCFCQQNLNRTHIIIYYIHVTKINNPIGQNSSYLILYMLIVCRSLERKEKINRQNFEHNPPRPIIMEIWCYTSCSLVG